MCVRKTLKNVGAEARSVYWKKWEAKHEYEDLKEGAWLEPGLAPLRKKVRKNCTEKHRNVGRSSWEEVHRKAQALPLPRMVRSQTRDSRGFQKVGAESENFKEGVEVAKRYRRASSQ